VLFCYTLNLQTFQFFDNFAQIDDFWAPFGYFYTVL